MSEPSLPELEAERDRLFALLASLGDFRRGSVSENYRKCGKPNCACAAPDHPGHGPRFLWTRSAGRRKTVGRQLAAGEVAKVRGEVARHGEFASTVGAGHRGEREDLRGEPPSGTAWMRSPRRRAKKGALRRARDGEVRRDRAACGGGGPVAGLRRCQPGDGRGGDPGRDAGRGLRHARAAAGLRLRLPRPAGPVRPGSRGRVHRLPGQGHRHRARPGHPQRAPGTTARNAGTAWPRGTPSSASPARRCRPAWPR